MKKVFFYLMLVVAVLFSACEPKPTPGENTGGDGAIDASTVMTLNPSELVMVIGEQIRVRPVLNPAPTVDYNVVWTSSDKNVVVVENGLLTALTEGEVTVTAQIEGTEIKATASVVVSNAYDAVDFYDAALWNLRMDEDENVYEYPFKGYILEENGDTTWVTDVNEDGVDDVVRECYLYVFSKGIYTDDQGLAGENDYLMLVTTASIYDGKYYYCIGDYVFTDNDSICKKECKIKIHI